LPVSAVAPNAAEHNSTIMSATKTLEQIRADPNVCFVITRSVRYEKIFVCNRFSHS
jgi:hypothetical protein